MKKYGKLLLVVLTVIFLQINVVNAASKCDYSEQVELNDAVANIKVSYEEAKGKVDSSLILESDAGITDVYYNYFKVQIYNMPDNVYLKVTNDYNDDVKYLYYRDSESGVVTFDWNNLDKVTNLKIVVYSSSNTGCPNEEYRIIYLTLPRYNELSDSARCVGNETYYLCQKYITESAEIDYTTFNEKLTAYESTKQEDGENIGDDNQSSNNAFLNFINNNKVLIAVVSTIIVVGGVVTIVIVIKKRRSRLI